MIGKAKIKPPKPYLPKELKSEWQYLFLRGAWCLLPKSGTQKPDLSITEAKAIVKMSYQQRNYARSKHKS